MRAIGMAAALVLCSLPAVAKDKPPQGEIAWLDRLSVAMERAKAEKKPVFVAINAVRPPKVDARRCCSS